MRISDWSSDVCSSDLHGHFDRLGWLYYDETGAVVTDYGAARFLNVEAKHGGRYLPENDSWASTTIAHNTLVVDEQSHFAGDRSEEHTSEIQSLMRISYAVFCLHKKNKTKHQNSK